MPTYKQIYLDFAAGVLCAGGPLPSYESMTQYSPPLHTVYVHKVYLFTQGRGEGGGES
jgi:hypothetical protein